MSYSIQCNPAFNYDDVIRIMNVELDIPVPPNCNMLSETILNILMGTRQIREGSKPNLDYQYRTKISIDEFISKNKTIIVIVPAGPKKPTSNGDFVDLAEYWFIKILNELGQKVSSLYEPGIKFRIITEDSSMILFEPDELIESAYSYVDKLRNLIKVFGYDKYVEVRPESHYVTPDELRELGKDIYPVMYHFLDDSVNGKLNTSSMKRLIELGWSGHISTETIIHYLKTFKNNYPNNNLQQNLQGIALYLATSFARYKAGVRNGIQVANAKRVPGVEFGRYNRIFYRTVPLSRTKTHIPFWRARGVIANIEGEHITKLFPFNNTPEVEENNVQITNSKGDKALLRIDILL